MEKKAKRYIKLKKASKNVCKEPSSKQVSLPYHTHQKIIGMGGFELRVFSREIPSLYHHQLKVPTHTIKTPKKSRFSRIKLCCFLFDPKKWLKLNYSLRTKLDDFCFCFCVFSFSFFFWLLRFLTYFVRQKE